MKLIFLDIDGVLNDHTPWSNGYCRIERRGINILNEILHAVPDAKLVLSSAWRYTVNTTSAIETLLAVHGCNCVGRIHGMTEADELTHDGPMPEFKDREAWSNLGIKLRATQIHKYVLAHKPRAWVVLDDLALDISNLVKTDPSIGLRRADADVAITLLG